MRHIGHLADPAQARLFGDLLVAKGIPNEIEAEADGSSLIWIREDDQLAAAQEWLNQFRANPTSAAFRDSAALAAKARKNEAEDRKQYQRRVRTAKSLFPAFGAYGAGKVTCVLIGLCVVITLLARMSGNDELLKELFISDPTQLTPGFLPEVFKQGQIWRLLTPVFLHFGVLHLVFNMIWLYQLGSLIEARLGPWHLLLLVVGTGIFSNLAQYIVAGPQFGGMSGVVYALAGYVWIRGKFDHASGLFLNQQSVTILLVWLVVCFTGILGPVANWAHLGGLVSGMASGWILAYLAARRPE